MIGIVFLLLLILSTLGIYTYRYLKGIFKYVHLERRLEVVITLIICATVIILGVNIFNGTAIVILHWLLFGLITNLGFFLIRKIFKKTYPKLKDSGIIPIVLTFLTMSYAYFNMINIKETHYEITTDKTLKQSYDLLFISDLHILTTMNIDKLNKEVAKINKKNYDFVILGGDIVDESVDKKTMQETFKALGNINNKYGIYYVYGNHDEQLYSRNPYYTKEELTNALKENDITILCDTDVTINDDVIIYGRDEISRNQNRLDTNDIIKTLDEDKFKLIIDHQPLDVTKNANLGFDMQLSGHTHAGQIFPANIVIELFINELAYGHETRGDYDIIVSSGMAGWGFPLRTTKHSEYVTIHLKEA